MPFANPEQRRAYQKKYQRQYYLRNRDEVIKRTSDNRRNSTSINSTLNLLIIAGFNLFSMGRSSRRTRLSVRAMALFLRGVTGRSGIVPNMEPGKILDMSTFGFSFNLKTTLPSRSTCNEGSMVPCWMIK